MSNPDVAEGLKRLFDRRSNFILIGLTGRTGSGCTTAANLLTKDFEELKLSQPTIIGAAAEDRKYRIVKDYAERNWRPFFNISISNVILSFLLDHTAEKIRDFFASAGLLTQEGQVESFIKSWQPAQEAWLNSKVALDSSGSTLAQREGLITAWRGPIQDFFKTVRSGLGPAASTKILQLVGDNLRKSGNPFDATHMPVHFYELPDRVSQIIHVIKSIQNEKKTSDIRCS